MRSLKEKEYTVVTYPVDLVFDRQRRNCYNWLRVNRRLQEVQRGEGGREGGLWSCKHFGHRNQQAT